jgi:acetyl-CoA decarbonylase/synthase complex subunit gamma
VQAHVVQKETGFVVRYGPIRADDIPAYLDNGRKVTPEMRMVRFPLSDRLALTPMELIGYGKYVLLLILILALLSGFGAGVYSFARVWTHGLQAAIPLVAGTLAGAVLVPVLLRWLPGRTFSAKGMWAGWLVWILLSVLFVSRPFAAPNWAGSAAGVMLTLSVASFIGMNFTGSSTYTSLSGVQLEMKRWVPVQAVLAVIGLGLWVTARFV